MWAADRSRPRPRLPAIRSSRAAGSAIEAGAVCTCRRTDGEFSDLTRESAPLDRRPRLLGRSARGSRSPVCVVLRRAALQGRQVRPTSTRRAIAWAGRPRRAVTLLTSGRGDLVASVAAVVRTESRRATLVEFARAALRGARSPVTVALHARLPLLTSRLTSPPLLPRPPSSAPSLARRDAPDHLRRLHGARPLHRSTGRSPTLCPCMV